MNLKQAIDHITEVLEMDYITDDQKEALTFAIDVVKRLNICNHCNLCIVKPDNLIPESDGSWEMVPVVMPSEDQVVIFMGKFR
jgi:hypothetical protein